MNYKKVLKTALWLAPLIADDTPAGCAVCQ
jgi:hypothetical protein